MRPRALGASLSEPSFTGTASSTAKTTGSPWSQCPGSDRRLQRRIRCNRGEQCADHYPRVNRRRLEERYFYPDHPHSVVLSHLLERIDELAASEDELALIIADEVDQADPTSKSWMFQRYSTTGYRARQLTRIIDTLHFAPSTSSRLAQAADLVAFMHQSASRPMRTRTIGHAEPTRPFGNGFGATSNTSGAGNPETQTHKGPAVAGPKAVRDSPFRFLLRS